MTKISFYILILLAALSATPLYHANALPSSDDRFMLSIAPNQDTYTRNQTIAVNGVISPSPLQDRSDLPPFFAYPQWLTFFDVPCDSSSSFNYHLFNDVKVISFGTVTQVRP